MRPGRVCVQLPRELLGGDEAVPENIEELKKLVAELRGQIKVKDNAIASLTLQVAKAGGGGTKPAMKTDKTGKFQLKATNEEPIKEGVDAPVSVTDASPAKPPPQPAAGGEAKSMACILQ